MQNSILGKRTLKTHNRASRFSIAIVKMREATVNYFPIRNNLTNQLIRSGDRKWSIRYDTLNYLEFRSPDLDGDEPVGFTLVICLYDIYLFPPA